MGQHFFQPCTTRYQARGSLPSHASVFPVAFFAFPDLKVGHPNKKTGPRNSEMNFCVAATRNVQWDGHTKPPCAQRNSTQQTEATQTQFEIKAPTLYS